MADKVRADVLLCQKELCESRQKAQALIMSGKVFVDEEKVEKASLLLPFDANILIREKEHSYVSRGALKLEKALLAFNVDVSDKVCLDIGAATGGFTDVLLQKGARQVYAVDVGYGQFDWKLRQDSRVKLFERYNARYLERSLFEELPKIMVMDVSFISIKLIIPRVIEILGEDSRFYVLIKPQFEVGKSKVGKNGVVKNPDDHIQVIVGISEFLNQLGWCMKKLDYSPIKGPKGNIEYICEIVYQSEDSLALGMSEIIQVVNAAHSFL